MFPNYVPWSVPTRSSITKLITGNETKYKISLLWGFSASEMWHSKVHSVKTTFDTVSTSWASCHIIIPFISPPPHSRSIYFNSGCCRVNQYAHAFLRNFYPTFIKCYSVAKKVFVNKLRDESTFLLLLQQFLRVYYSFHLPVCILFQKWSNINKRLVCLNAVCVWIFVDITFTAVCSVHFYINLFFLYFKNRAYTFFPLK